MTTAMIPHGDGRTRNASRIAIANSTASRVGRRR
jgi:hypothetical protein